jgi:hypothetical protein
MSTEEFSSLEASQSVRRIAFTDAQVVTGIVPGTYFLVVSGETPCVNVRVELLPLIYITCPEYWGIEVVGTLRGGHCIMGIVPTPFSVSIPLSGVIGSRGIEVLGSGASRRFDLDGGCSGDADGPQ